MVCLIFEIITKDRDWGVSWRVGLLWLLGSVAFSWSIYVSDGLDRLLVWNRYYRRYE